MGRPTIVDTGVVCGAEGCLSTEYYRPSMKCVTCTNRNRKNFRPFRGKRDGSTYFVVAERIAEVRVIKLVPECSRLRVVGTYRRHSATNEVL